MNFTILAEISEMRGTQYGPSFSFVLVFFPLLADLPPASLWPLSGEFHEPGSLLDADRCKFRKYVASTFAF